MKRFVAGIVLGMLVAAPPLWAFRFARPPTFTEWNSNTFTQLNDVLLQIWNTLNGRFTLDTVTTTPKNNRNGNKGDMVFFDTGTDQLCVNVAGTIASWSCTNLTPL